MNFEFVKITFVLSLTVSLFSQPVRASEVVQKEMKQVSGSPQKKAETNSELKKISAELERGKQLYDEIPANRSASETELRKALKTLEELRQRENYSIAEIDHLRTEALALLGEQDAERGSYTVAKGCFQQVINICSLHKSKKFKLTEAKAFYHLALSELPTDPRAGLDHLKKSSRIFSSLTSSKSLRSEAMLGQITAALFLGNCEILHESTRNEAEVHLHQVIDLCNKLSAHDPSMYLPDLFRADALVALSEISGHRAATELFEKALLCFKFMDDNNFDDAMYRYVGQRKARLLIRYGKICSDKAVGVVQLQQALKIGEEMARRNRLDYAGYEIQAEAHLEHALVDSGLRNNQAFSHFKDASQACATALTKFPESRHLKSLDELITKETENARLQLTN